MYLNYISTKGRIGISIFFSATVYLKIIFGGKEKILFDFFAVKVYFCTVDMRMSLERE